MTDNTNASELLPCPFCGGEAGVMQQSKVNWAVMCHVCGAEGGWVEILALVLRCPRELHTAYVSDRLGLRLATRHQDV